MLTVYLGIKYSDPDPIKRHRRFFSANQAAAYLYSCGFNVFSPISHCHPIAAYLNNENSGDFWLERVEFFQRKCDIFCVYETSEDWRTSKGLARELELARSIKQPIMYLSEQTVKQLFKI